MNRVFSMAQRYLVGKAMTAAAILAVTGAGTSAFAALPIISTPTSALAANYSITSDGHVHFFYGSSSGWSQLDITAASNSVGAAPTTALTEVYNASKNSFEVLYVGSDGQIYGIYSIGTTWLYESPTALAGAPAATNSAALTSVDLSGNGTDRVYYVGPAGHIEELAAGGSTGWGVTDVTATIASGSPAVAGTALTSLVYATTDTPRIYFFDANWHLQELNFGEGWHEADVTAQSGGPAAVSGSSLTSLIYRTDPSDADEAPRVYYFGANHHVLEMAWGQGWHATDISNSSGAPAGIAGSSLASLSWQDLANPQIYYVSSDAHVRRINWGGGWSTDDFSAQTCAAGVAMGSALASFVQEGSTYGIFYTSADAHIHKFEVPNGSLYLTDINGTGVAVHGCPTTPPTSGGGGSVPR